MSDESEILKFGAEDKDKGREGGTNFKKMKRDELGPNFCSTDVLKRILAV